MPVELVVPKVGESITEVEIGEWVKAEGDTVGRDETVVMLDSAKATVELPSPVAGVISQIVKQTGEVVAVGDVIAYLEEGGAATKQPATKASSVAAQEPTAEWSKPDVPGEEPSAVPEGEAEKPQPFVMPAAQRVLAQNNMNAGSVQGTGPGGRVLKEDAVRGADSQSQTVPQPTPATPPTPAAPVTAAPVTSAAPVTAPAQAGPSAIEHPAPTPVAAKSSAPQTALAPTSIAGEPVGEEEIVPMNMLRRHIAQRLVEAQQTAALLTTFNEIDMSAVMALRKEHQDAFQKRYGIKLGFMSFFVKAAIDALKLIPAVNAEIRGNNIVYKNHYDIGVAIGGGKGLVVPVLRHAERMSFAEIEVAIADFAQRVKDSKINPDELTGGTFTITNGGIYGSLLSTPIVNPPQSGILGMHSIQERPVARNGEVVIRPMMYIALTYDHRIVDGREAVTFLKRIADCIENPARMLIEV